MKLTKRNLTSGASVGENLTVKLMRDKFTVPFVWKQAKMKNENYWLPAHGVVVWLLTGLPTLSSVQQEMWEMWYSSWTLGQMQTVPLMRRLYRNLYMYKYVAVWECKHVHDLAVTQGSLQYSQLDTVHCTYHGLQPIHWDFLLLEALHSSSSLFQNAALPLKTKTE